MIPRYTRREMSAIWTEETKFTLWLDIEIAALEAMVQLKQAPASALESVKEAVKQRRPFDIPRIREIESHVHHDLIAFLTNVAESIGEDARFLHQGLTSSDVMDTAFALQLTRACDLLLLDVEALCETLKTRALEHKHTLCIGRSHGIHAEPTTFGLKLATAWAEFQRHHKRLQHARKEIAICALSGAVGTYSTVDPRVEAHVAKVLQLSTEDLSTQVIPRDRHAMFFSILAVVAGSVERLAVEIRHLQRTEVLEAEERFAPEQKGSSAMPHKRNPVLSENLTGLARLVRSMALPALENVALWHERDISHSSVERVIGGGATITLDFALTRLTQIVKTLQVYPEKMRRNLDMLQGLVCSQRVLLALIAKGVTREEAYTLTQRNAMKAWETQTPFLDHLQKDKHITQHLSQNELHSLFDMAWFTRHTDTLFQRLFGP